MKKRLKPLRERKPQKTTTVKEMCEFISKETGFRQDDIQIVIKSLARYVKHCMMLKLGVSLPKIGILYPLIKPARTVMSMNGGVGTPTKMKMDSRWQMKFKASESVDRELADIEVSEEEYNDLYQ